MINSFSCLRCADQFRPPGGEIRRRKQFGEIPVGRCFLFQFKRFLIIIIIRSSTSSSSSSLSSFVSHHHHHPFLIIPIYPGLIVENVLLTRSMALSPSHFFRFFLYTETVKATLNQNRHFWLLWPIFWCPIVDCI